MSDGMSEADDSTRVLGSKIRFLDMYPGTADHSNILTENP